MLGGVPTPLDPFEMRRLLFTLTLISSLTSTTVTSSTAAAPTRGLTAAHGRDAVGRRHVRPPRSC